MVFKILYISRQEPVFNTFVIWHDKDMKRLLVLSLLVALCASLQPAFSANLKDVKRLKLLRMCKGCDLSDAKLRYADLKNAMLIGANLSGADLKAADLSGSNLTGANLTDADLSESDLNGSVLVDADLRGADLYNANLLRSDLRGADLSTIEIDASRLIEATICKTKTKAGEQNRDCS